MHMNHTWFSMFKNHTPLAFWKLSQNHFLRQTILVSGSNLEKKISTVLNLASGELPILCHYLFFLTSFPYIKLIMLLFSIVNHGVIHGPLSVAGYVSFHNCTQHHLLIEALVHRRLERLWVCQQCQSLLLYDI